LDKDTDEDENIVLYLYFRNNSIQTVLDVIRYYVKDIYMDYFYIIVPAIGIIILILLLTFIGILLRSQYNKSVFPPTSNTCPDGWSTTSSSKCIVPTASTSNYQNTGVYPNGDLYDATGVYGGLNPRYSNKNPPYLIHSSSSSSPGYLLDPSSGSWSQKGLTTICAKKAWANQYNILWDGVSNYNQC